MMKMITAIVNKRDADAVCDAPTRGNFMFTKMATTGGFLRSGNTTLLIGTEDERVKKAVEIIRENCAQRMEKVPSVISSAGPYAVFNYTTAELPVGGATVFVTDVEYYEKM